ncbi:MAG: class I SAM-dependent methyltransferase [Candidatus Hadarchaeales archaeon]
MKEFNNCNGLKNLHGIKYGKVTKTRLECPACELCGEKKGEKVVDLGTFTIQRCKSCGLGYTSPRIPEKEMLKYYVSEQRKIHRTPKAEGITSFLRTAWYTYLSAIKDPCMLEKVPPGKVLDVGCGWGEILEKLRKRGWETYGIEINRDAAKHAQGFGRIYTCELTEAKFPKDFFDAVILRHVLEHVYHPLEILAEIHRILKTGGILVIEVPEIDSVEARIFKSFFPIWNPPRHLYHFSRSTLEAFLKKSGFMIVEISHSPSPIGFLSSLDKIFGTGQSFQHPFFTILFFPFTLMLSKIAPTCELRVVAKK